MSLAVTFPDVTVLLTTYYAAALPDVVSGIAKPEQMAGKQVLMFRPNGGPQPGRVLRAQNVAFTVFAPDEATVADLAEAAVTLLKALEDIDNSGVSAVEILSAPNPVIDDSLIPCRYFTAQLFIRGS